MIAKKTDEKQNLKSYQKYGYNAEKQMAFYLKRAFQDTNNIIVINDLRIEMNDDVAQIDHLIIHQFGFIIIESKSVTSEISINEYGEWTRHYPKFTRGMPSPINQARRQADFLKNFLMARTEQLLRKKIVFKTSFSDFKFDVLVAISDSGIINRAKNTEISEVHKADQITEAINSLISSYAGTNKYLLTLKVNYYFSDSTLHNVFKYLLKSHKPSTYNAIEDKEIKQSSSFKKKTLSESKPERSNYKKKTYAIKQTSQKDNSKICSKCRSSDIEIVYGKYGYYFKCKDCNGNTPIKLKCLHDTCKPRIKKKKLKFYKECSVCNKSELYFENKLVETN